MKIKRLEIHSRVRLWTVSVERKTCYRVNGVFGDDSSGFMGDLGHGCSPSRRTAWLVKEEIWFGVMMAMT